MFDIIWLLLLLCLQCVCVCVSGWIKFKGGENAPGCMLYLPLPVNWGRVTSLKQASALGSGSESVQVTQLLSMYMPQSANCEEAVKMNDPIGSKNVLQDFPLSLCSHELKREFWVVQAEGRKREEDLKIY